jgi:tRNA(Ile)-lysidine synthase
MLRAALALKGEAGGSGRLFVAHLNHALRGRDADADQAWLRALCDRLAMPLEIGHTDVRKIAETQGDGLEAAARTARYDFLRQTAERLGARFVATAHTLDDQVETLLQRILRGTGLAGLVGIPQTRPLSPSITLVRPLLAARRPEVLDYLAAIGQDFRTDASNLDPRFTRNRIRNELLPLLREHYNAEADAALLRLAAHARESQKVIADLAADLARQCVAIDRSPPTATGRGGEDRIIRIDCRPLSDKPAVLIREVCKIAWSEVRWPQQAMGFDHWQQLAEMAAADGDVPAVTMPASVRAGREKHLLVLERLGLP